MQRQESVQKVPFTPAIYQTAPSVRERTATLIAVVMVHAALALALLNLSGTPRLPLPDELSQLIDVTAEPPPPPIVEIQPERAQPRKPEGAASARNIESQATQIFAPKPVVELPTPQPIVASPTPALGAQATQGESNIVGPGTGAGGSGTGTGSGGAGAGDGGGGSGIAARARLISPSLRTRDYPSGLRDRLLAGSPPFVLFTVGSNGRVTNCRIYQSSGDPVIDMVTCSLVTARFAYRPAVNQRGQLVASDNGYEQRN